MVTRRFTLALQSTVFPPLRMQLTCVKRHLARQA
ncbi:hypothetical protein DM42_4890 [Burkholderia cepacia]|nr:hypothetical protein DM42_4890 [Burkholderia cepacia]